LLHQTEHLHNWEPFALAKEGFIIIQGDKKTKIFHQKLHNKNKQEIKQF
jgi:hypothetical protein